MHGHPRANSHQAWVAKRSPQGGDLWTLKRGCSQVTELESGSQTGVYPGAILLFGLFCTLSLPQPWRLQKQQSEGTVERDRRSWGREQRKASSYPHQLSSLLMQAWAQRDQLWAQRNRGNFGNSRVLIRIWASLLGI